MIEEERDQEEELDDSYKESKSYGDDEMRQALRRMEIPGFDGVDL